MGVAEGDPRIIRGAGWWSSAPLPCSLKPSDFLLSGCKRAKLVPFYNINIPVGIGEMQIVTAIISNGYKSDPENSEIRRAQIGQNYSVEI